MLASFGLFVSCVFLVCAHGVFFVSILLLSLSLLRACFCLWQHCCVRYLSFGDVPKTLPKQWRAVCSPKKERDHYHRQNAIMTLAPAPTHGFTVLCISTMSRLHPTKCGEQCTASPGGSTPPAVNALKYSYWHPVPCARQCPPKARLSEQPKHRPTAKRAPLPPSRACKLWRVMLAGSH